MFINNEIIFNSKNIFLSVRINSCNIYLSESYVVHTVCVYIILTYMKIIFYTQFDFYYQGLFFCVFVTVCK